MNKVPWKLWLARLPLVALAITDAFVMAQTEQFLTWRTLSNILMLSSIVGVLAIGQAFVLIGGGFDLSQGAALALTAGAAALLTRAGFGPVPAGAAALALGAGLGAINGLFVAVVGTNAFVTTLSAMLIFRGAAFVLLGGQPINRVSAFDPLSRVIELGGTPFALRGFLFLAATAAAWVVLRQTVFGQYVYAVGGNAEAARLAGVRTRRVRVATFALSGLAAAAAALLWLSWVRVAKPDTAEGLELDSIAACVVGGISLQGGAGSVLGAAAGCLLLQMLGTQITMSGWPDQYRALITGAVILTFAAADALARRSSRR